MGAHTLGRDPLRQSHPPVWWMRVGGWAWAWAVANGLCLWVPTVWLAALVLLAALTWGLPRWHSRPVVMLCQHRQAPWAEWAEWARSALSCLTWALARLPGPNQGQRRPSPPSARSRLAPLQPWCTSSTAG
jgi:hypothetical protein